MCYAVKITVKDFLNREVHDRRFQLECITGCCRFAEALAAASVAGHTCWAAAKGDGTNVPSDVDTAGLHGNEHTGEWADVLSSTARDSAQRCYDAALTSLSASLIAETKGRTRAAVRPVVTSARFGVRLRRFVDWERQSDSHPAIATLRAMANSNSPTRESPHVASVDQALKLLPKGPSEHGIVE